VISHPDKVLFPGEGITKGELAEYYASVAAVMLPHLRQRPITMERFPQGIGAKGILQKDVGRGAPDWLKRAALPKKAGGTVNYALVNDRRSLEWLANQNTVAIHIWPARVPRVDGPDLCIFDLDPSVDDVGVLRQAALHVRALLDELGVPCGLKTSGSRGFHIAVPLDSRTSFDESHRFARRVADILEERHPRLFTQEQRKADRKDRILIDIGRNRAGATFVAPYSVRARPGAPVSAPCTWNEVEDGTVGPRAFTLQTLQARIADVGDLWEEFRRRTRTSAAVREVARH
jgi:bifunctional non-homologous end joining protein LigD